MAYAGRSFFARVFLALMLVLSLMLLTSVSSIGTDTTPKAYASGYNDNSQGDCSPGYPRGTSWLNWWGQGGSASGTTVATLYYYDSNAGWVSFANGNNSQGGDTNNAQVTNTHSYVGGSYQEAGAHTATFFSGTQYTNSGVWNC